MHVLSPIYYIVFTAVTAAGVLLQAFVLLAIYIAIRRSTGELQKALNEVKEKALPAIASTQSLLDDVSPKLKAATSNLSEVSEVLRSQASHVNATVESLLDKTNAQINRVDEMVTATFNALSHASKAIDAAIGLPARRINGMLHGLRVGVDVLLGKRSGGPQPSANEAEVSEQKPAEQKQTEEEPVQQKPA